MSSVTESPSEGCELPTGYALPRTDNADPSPLSKDVLFELLKNQRRRNVLRYLETDGPVATLSDLAEHVAALENGIPESHLSSQQRKRVYVALYQCHLPILARADVIEYNQARGIIERTLRADQLSPYLQEEDRPEAQWAVANLGLTVVGALAYGGSVLAGGLSWLSPAVVAVFIAAVAGLSLLQLRDGSGLPGAFGFPASLARIGRGNSAAEDAG